MHPPHSSTRDLNDLTTSRPLVDHGAFTPTAHDSRGLRGETGVSSITRNEPASVVRRERALGGGGVRRRARTSTADDILILDDGHLEEIILDHLEGILDVEAVSDARGGVATDVGSRIDEETREQSVERSGQGARGVRRRTQGEGTHAREC